MKNRFVPRLFAAAILLLGASEGFADVIYETDSPNPNELWGIRWDYQVTFPTTSSSIGVAARFQVPSGVSYRLDSVRLPLRHYTGAINLEISLFSDAKGAPGLLLENIAANPANVESTALYTFSSFLSPLLAGGRNYWLVVQPHDHNVTDQTQNATYDWNAAFFQFGQIGMRDYDFAANDWGAWTIREDSFPALRIEGTPVPEPSTWVLVAIAGSLFWFGVPWKKK